MRPISKCLSIAVIWISGLSMNLETLGPSPAFGMESDPGTGQCKQKSDPLNSRSLSATAAAITVANSHLNLQHAGLERLGNSNFYLKDQIMVDLSSPSAPEIYLETLYRDESGKPEKDWKYVHADQAQESQERLIRRLPNPITLESLHEYGFKRHSEAGELYVKENFEKISDFDLEKQYWRTPECKELSKIIATKRELHQNYDEEETLRRKGMEQYISNYDKKKSSEAIFLKNGKLDRVFNSLYPYKNRLPKKYEILHAHSKSILDQKGVHLPITEVTLTDGQANYVISSRAKAEPESRYGGGPVISIEYLKDITESELFTLESSTHWPPTKIEASSGFTIGGKNRQANIKKLTVLNEIPIHQIEEALRPGKSSKKGFLGQYESLISLLEEDNHLVTEKLGLTHQAIAQPMMLAEKAFQKSGSIDTLFSYHGKKFKVSGTAYRGYQVSPFGDQTKPHVDLTVTNLDTGATIQYSGLVPEMIWHYGFYEGKQTPYRVNPEDIVKLFNISP